MVHAKCMFYNAFSFEINQSSRALDAQLPISIKNFIEEGIDSKEMASSRSMEDSVPYVNRPRELQMWVETLWAVFDTHEESYEIGGRGAVTDYI